MAKDKDVTLATVEAVAELQKAEVAAIKNDKRPRTQPVRCSELGEGLVFQRLASQQIVALRQRLESVEHKSNVIVVTDKNRGHAIKAIQIGLRNGRFLAFPGDDGFNKIGRLKNAELSRLASEALKFNEVFDDKS